MSESAEPSEKYWLEDLELDSKSVLDGLTNDARIEWVQKRTQLQTWALCNALRIERKTHHARKQALQEVVNTLDTFYLVSKFASGRGDVAIRDLASRVLPLEVLSEYVIAEDRIDKMAMLFALFQAKPSHLKSVRLLDRIHKSGFAPMRLRGTVRAPADSMTRFLTKSTIRPILASADEEASDGRRSVLQGVLERNGRSLIFVRRAGRSRFAVKALGAPTPCYDSDTIVLDMGTDGRRIGIAAKSGGVAVQIANGLATAYFGKECKYQNETNTIDRSAMEAFCRHLMTAIEGTLVLVEFKASCPGLAGTPQVVVSHSCSRSIGDAIRQLEASHGRFDLSDIESLKVQFGKKRVTLVVGPAGDGDDAFSLRYSEFRLNALERVDFENHLRDVHGITVLSTEMQRA